MRPKRQFYYLSNTCNIKINDNGPTTKKKRIKTVWAARNWVIFLKLWFSTMLCCCIKNVFTPPFCHLQAPCLIKKKKLLPNQDYTLHEVRFLLHPGCWLACHLGSPLCFAQGPAATGHGFRGLSNSGQAGDKQPRVTANITTSSVMPTPASI